MSVWSRKVTVPPWVRSRPDCLASAPGARASSRGRLRTQALPISRGCGNAPKNRQAEAHRTKKAITRSSSLRVIAASACSGVLLLESTACRSPWNSRLTFLSVLSVRRSRFLAAARRVRSRQRAQPSTSELACQCYRHRSRLAQRSTCCRSDGISALRSLALC